LAVLGFVVVGLLGNQSSQAHDFGLGCLQLRRVDRIFSGDDVQFGACTVEQIVQVMGHEVEVLGGLDPQHDLAKLTGREALFVADWRGYSVSFWTGWKLVSASDCAKEKQRPHDEPDE
jgi:hypothetical protein